MQPLATATALPAFDQAQLDKRFLTELARLLDAGVFATYKEWAQTLKVPESHVNGIASGRYHCNLKLLYGTLRHFPAFDYNYVLLGSAVYARPEPTEMPMRQRGAPRKTPAA